jgi:hypothetical protein
VHAAFGTVLLVVCGVSLVVAVVALLWNRGTWEEFGRGGLAFDSERPGSAEPPPGSAAAAAQRESEIRELLEARNARRARRGEAQVDVESEVSKLTGGGAARIDPALRSEIRELVVARNERLIRAGKPPLDVDGEVRREIETLADRGLVDPHGKGGFRVG